MSNFMLLIILRHHCIIGNPILSKGVCSKFINNHATLRFDPGDSKATIKVRIHQDKTRNDNGVSTQAVHLITDVTIPAGKMVQQLLL